MNVSFDKIELKRCFGYLSKIAVRTKKASNEAYKNIQFLFKDNQLHLYSMDGEYLIKVLYGDVNFKDSSYMIEYLTLNNLINLIDDDTINMDFEEDKIFINTKDNKYTLQCRGESDFSYILSELKDDIVHEVTMSILDISNAVHFVSACISGETVSSRYRGVFFDGNFVTTDESSLAIFPSYNEDPGKFFITKDGALILASFPKEDRMTLKCTSSHLIVENEKVVLMLPQLVAEFANYNSVLSRIKSYEYSIKIDRETLLKTCSRLFLFTDTYVRQSATFNISPEGVVIESQSETKQASENLIIKEMNTSQEHINFSINIKKLQELVASTTGDVLTLKYTDDMNTRNPLVIESENRSMYLLTTLYKLKTKKE